MLLIDIICTFILFSLHSFAIIALCNNLRTLKFKDKRTITFYAVANDTASCVLVVADIIIWKIPKFVPVFDCNVITLRALCFV